MKPYVHVTNNQLAELSQVKVIDRPEAVNHGSACVGYRRLRHVKRDLADARLAAYGLSLGMHHNLSVGVGGEVDAPHAGVGFERAHA